MEYLQNYRVEVTKNTNNQTLISQHDNAFDAAIEIVADLTDEQRQELFGSYCQSCGSSDPRCQCWNDE